MVLKSLVVIVFLAHLNNGAGSVGTFDEYDLTADLARSIPLDPGAAATLLRFSKIPTNVTHIVIQAHSQWRNLTLSESAVNHIQGSNVGLLTLLRVGQSKAEWNISSADKITAIVMVSVYTKRDPMPGACNMEFALENDPNMHLMPMVQSFKVQFAEANVGPSKRGSLPSCGPQSSQQRLSYKLYELWMHERDLSVGHYKQSLNKMLRPVDIRKHGTKVSEMTYHNGQTMKMFASYARQGVIYNTIVRYEWSQGHATEAAYVPAATYSCEDGCSTPTGESAYFVVLGIVGCLLCFGGHRLFEFELFVFGVLAFHIVSFVCIGNLTSLSFGESMLIACIPALGGGVLWLLIWMSFGVAVLSTLLPGLVLGYVAASVIFNMTPFGSMDWWGNDFNYSVAFCCFILSVPVMLLAFLKWMSILSCAIVGSYLAVLMMAFFLEGNIHRVYINTFRKAVVPGFVVVDDSIPFQFADVVLCICWVALSVVGILLQRHLVRNRPAFPQSPSYCVRKFRRSRNVAINTEANENTSLLRSPTEAEEDTPPPPTLVTLPPPVIDPL